MKRAITLCLVMTIVVTAGCRRRQQSPSPAPTVSPGAPMHWDVGSTIMQHPLPPGVDDGFLELGRGPEFSYGVTMARERLSARHHERSDIVLYVHNGSLRMHVGEKDFTAGTGDIVYIPRGAVYSAVSTTGQPFELFTVYAPPLSNDDVNYDEAVDESSSGVKLGNGDG